MSKSINDLRTVGDAEDYSLSPNWWRIHETEDGAKEVHTARRIISINARQVEDITTGRAIAVKHQGEYLRLNPTGQFTRMDFIGAIAIGIAGIHATIPAQPELITPEIVQRDLFGNETVVQPEHLPMTLPEPELPFDAETYLLSKQYACDLAAAALREGDDAFTTKVPLPSGGSVPLNECHVYSEMTLHKIVESAAAVVNWENYTLTMDADCAYDIALDALRNGKDPLQATMPTDFAEESLITDFEITGELTLELLIAEARAAYVEETAEIEHETREKEKA